MTTMEDVIRDAALKNHFSLKEDDPVMVLVTIMNRVCEDYQTSMNAALEEHRGGLQELEHRWRKNATVRANQVLNAALESGREAMAKGMNEGVQKVLEVVRREHDTVLSAQRAEMERAIGEFKRYVFYLMLGSAGVVSGLVVLLAVS